MKIKAVKGFKYSPNGRDVVSVEKDEIIEGLEVSLAERLCMNKFCEEVKAEKKPEPKAKVEKKPAPKAKVEEKDLEDKDFLG